MRIILRNSRGEVVAEFPFPEDWPRPGPDIIDVGGTLFRFFGRQDGLITYSLARVKQLPCGVSVVGEMS